MQRTTSLGGDDGDVVPVVALPVQLHRRGDEAGVGRDAEQRLRVGLGIDGEPAQTQANCNVREPSWWEKVLEVKPEKWAEGKSGWERERERSQRGDEDGGSQSGGRKQGKSVREW